MLPSAPRRVAAMPQCVIPMTTGGLLMAEARIIKRYANRKLYDTQHSRYVTLDQISEMIRAGDDVKIIDNKSKEDLTSVTLAQIIFEEEKKTSKMSLETLRDLIRYGGEVAQRLVEGARGDLRGKVEAVRAVAEQQLGSLLERGVATGDRAKEIVQASQDAISTVQRRIDERVRSTLDGVTNLGEARRQMEEMARRIEELEKRLDDVSKK